MSFLIIHFWTDGAAEPVADIEEDHLCMCVLRVADCVEGGRELLASKESCLRRGKVVVWGGALYDLTVANVDCC